VCRSRRSRRRGRDRRGRRGASASAAVCLIGPRGRNGILNLPWDGPWTRPVHEARVARMTQTSPPSSVLELLIGKWVAQAVSAAADLRIADELKDGPRPCAEVALLRGRVGGRALPSPPRARRGAGRRGAGRTPLRPHRPRRAAP
jgi:hypothetical protein